MIELLRKGSQEDKAKVTAQKHVPIKAVYDGMIITQDYRLIDFLQISAVNTQLMSKYQLNKLLENYEGFLKSLNFPVQQEIVSQPVDLTQYLKQQETILESQDSTSKKRLMRDYINHTEKISKSKQIIQRKRYMIISEKIKAPTKKDFFHAVNQIEIRREHIINGIKSVEKIKASRLTDLEAVRYFHIFFDYMEAQNNPIMAEQLPRFVTRKLITGGNEQ